MPALMPTDHHATVTWLGSVTDMQRDALMAQSLEEMQLTFAGIPGSVHGGQTRASCSRVTAQYPKGTEIRNERQVSILSEEEIAQIAARMGVDSIDPARLGASIVVRGLPDFSHLPPASRLTAPSGAALCIDMQNRPCVWPGKSLEVQHPGQGKGFLAAAKGLRGVTAWVAAEGALTIGDTLRLHIPDQRPWAPGLPL